MKSPQRKRPSGKLGTTAKPPVHVVRLVLHEAGYRCANPVCRRPQTLDHHHIVYVSDGGADDAVNLLLLCKNCHGDHHAGSITFESIRAWKMFLITLNEGYDRRSVDILLALSKTVDPVFLSGDGLLETASLLANDKLIVTHYEPSGIVQADRYLVRLSARGAAFVEAWKRGDQVAAIDFLPSV